jgi:hypothetical protein
MKQYLHNTPYFSPDDGGSMFLSNVCNAADSHTMPAPKNRAKIMNNHCGSLKLVLDSVEEFREMFKYIIFIEV